MSTRRSWWAVWSADYPDEGSLHVRATSRMGALATARSTGLFATEPGEEPEDLVAEIVTAEEHSEWLRSED